MTNAETKIEPVQEQAKSNDKEFNFAQLRKQLDQERAEKIQLQNRVSQIEKLQEQSRGGVDEDDAPSDEPYVDERRLNKKLAKFEERFDKKVDEKAEQKARQLLEQERQSVFLKKNPDFNEILQEDLIQKFADKYPEIAEPMLEMPANFARQKLLYQNIKALGIHKKEEPKQSIQETIDKNKRSPYYQPSNVGNAPYNGVGDFSEAGQKNAYQKLKELQSRLRL